MNFDWLSDLFWLFLIVVALTPLLQRRILQLRRAGGLQRLGRARGSRAIALIARRETYRILGFPVLRHDRLDSPEQVLRAIGQTPDTLPIDLIVHAHAGLSLAAEQIAHALIRHPARVTVFVPHYALSGATLIALAADQIVLDPNAVLGPITPWIGSYPAASLLALLHEKPAAALDDRTLVLVDQARRAVGQVRTVAVELLLARGATPAAATEIAQMLTGGHWTPQYPILLEEAQRLGLAVSDALPAEIYPLMDLYDLETRLRPATDRVAIECD